MQVTEARSHCPATPHCHNKPHISASHSAASLQRESACRVTSRDSDAYSLSLAGRGGQATRATPSFTPSSTACCYCEVPLPFLLPANPENKGSHSIHTHKHMYHLSRVHSVTVSPAPDVCEQQDKNHTLTQ